MRRNPNEYVGVSRGTFSAMIAQRVFVRSDGQSRNGCCSGSWSFLFVKTESNELRWLRQWLAIEGNSKLTIQSCHKNSCSLGIRKKAPSLCLAQCTSIIAELRTNNCTLFYRVNSPGQGGRHDALESRIQQETTLRPLICPKVPNISLGSPWNMHKMIVYRKYSYSISSTFRPKSRRGYLYLQLDLQQMLK
eukprot:gb/GECG01014292.1/.p1 GENE.gb/GECG01014292.1/~~gb/GECG01014292.1/.p1  ORF type:complete len:191 (+),score=14.55 gb/GECG01014292.1/:1-573(+)